MHDIDRTIIGYNPETELMPEVFEYDEAEWSSETGVSGVFSENEEMELAAELLGVASEQELDRFLGGLILKAGRAVGQLAKSPTGQALGRAGRAVGQFVRSPTGQALGGILKGAVGGALPAVGQVLGGRLGGEKGADWGERVGGAAAQIFGLEVEGLSLEDQEFEAAKHFVRFAGEAVKNAVLAPTSANAKTAAQAAVVSAAQQLAPGLLAPASASPAAPGHHQSGRWIRRGNTIILLGV
jgi:hypothetical protein